jgi:hypothetical protein
MSQSLAESHVGVSKRRFASFVRARMTAIGEEDEESKRAVDIKKSWPDLAEVTVHGDRASPSPIYCLLMQGQKALGPEPLQATTYTEAASRRLCVWCCRWVKLTGGDDACRVNC